MGIERVSEGILGGLGAERSRLNASERFNLVPFLNLVSPDSLLAGQKRNWHQLLYRVKLMPPGLVKIIHASQAIDQHYEI